MAEEAKNSDQNKQKNGVHQRSIVTEMRESYLDYAMSVITSRALPDVRDGLKPVHRRILYTMHNMGLTSSAKFRKSAAVVGDVMGKYHPHGDTAIYDSMVQMAQDFKYRYPLVFGQGNFGSIDGDPPAAMRYTEAKMQKITAEMLRDLDKDTVDWRPNYDATRKEPVVLPSVAPALLLNGTLGIAVGMATNIPPHNLQEVVGALVHLIDNKNATTEDLVTFIKGPDFPTGGTMFGSKDLLHAYATGKGGVVVRGEAEIVDTGKDGFQIVIKSIPYRVNKAVLISAIAGLVRDKKLEGIKGLRDESTKDIRIVIDLKGTAHPQKVLNFIYKHSQLEETFHFNVVALLDGVPQMFSLKALLEEFIKHRQEVVVRRATFELAKAEDREHILLGLKKALDHIDKIIKTIRASKDAPTAHIALMKEYKFSDKQATAILEMRLQKLAGLERKKIDDELKSIQKLIGELKALLASPKKILSVIKTELQELAQKFGDERRTKIVRSSVKNMAPEDLIPDEESVLVMTTGGYIKRTNPSEYRKQRRGGVGVVDLNTKEEDFVTRLLTTSTHSDLLFFSDKGKVYQIKMYDLPEGKRATRGKSIMNFLPLASDETIASILPVPKNTDMSTYSIAMVTQNGVVKKVSASGFDDVRRSGIIAIKLANDDKLIAVTFVDQKDQIVVTTKRGQSIRFKSTDTRDMGRTASGVHGIKLQKGDTVVGASRADHNLAKPQLLVISENGYGKKTDLKEYKIQKRGGSGIKTIKISKKTGDLMISIVVDQNVDDADVAEVVAMSKKGQVIRVGLDEIPTLGRQTQGVRIMKLRAGDSIASLICL